MEKSLFTGKYTDRVEIIIAIFFIYRFFVGLKETFFSNKNIVESWQSFQRIKDFL